MAKSNNEPVDLNFTLYPTKTSVLFAYGYVITSNENGLTFNFAKRLAKSRTKNNRLQNRNDKEPG